VELEVPKAYSAGRRRIKEDGGLRSANPSDACFYRCLIAAGKPHNLALTACARKLIIYANTVVLRGTPWTERQPTT